MRSTPALHAIPVLPATWRVADHEFPHCRDVVAGVRALVPLHRAAMYADVARVVGWDDAVQHGRLARAVAGGALFLAHRAARAVASFVLTPAPGFVTLSQLYVHPEAQARGLGSAVCRAVQDFAAAAALDVRLTVLHGSRAAALYERLGWVAVATTPWETAMVWRADEAAR